MKTGFKIIFKTDSDDEIM